jgi:RNA polymerase sigma-70 factor (ECF subfamily)
MSLQRNTTAARRLLRLISWKLPLTTRPESSDDVAGLRSGSPEAWGALCETYSERLWRYVARLLGSNHDVVADAVQETFLAAARSASKFDPDRGTVWAWLTGIAHHQVALHWRKMATRRIDPAEPYFDDSPGGGASPEERLLTDDSVEQVQQILAELPADYSSYLVAKYNDGLSIDEMVGRFGGTVEAVRSRLSRARREFKKRYEAATVSEAGRSG